MAERRDWEASDLISRFDQLHKPRSISFSINFLFPETGSVTWKGDFNIRSLSCTSESITVDGDLVLETPKHKLRVKRKDDVWELISVGDLEFQGSALSLLKTDEFHPGLGLLKEYALSLQSLELLNPQDMKRRAREGGDPGSGGERLAGYLHGLKPPERLELERLLREFYSGLQGMEVKSFRGGWKELIATEGWGTRPLKTRARHLNDGMLRMIAILSQTQLLTANSKPARCILFDEIENGINPELVRKLIEILLKSPNQIIVTTHSP